MANDIYRLMRLVLDPVCLRHGITNQQMLVLVMLKAHPNARMSEVSDALGMLRPNFTALARKMVEAGLIERTQGEADRRYYRLSLTQAGRDIVDALERELAGKNELISRAITPQMYADAVRGMSALRAIVHEVEIGMLR